MSNRKNLVAQAVEGPQLRTLPETPQVDLRSSLIRQIVTEGQECQACIRRFRRSGLVAWLEQAERMNVIHNVHNIIGTAFEKVADEIGLDSSTAYGLLQLHPFAQRLLEECDQQAAIDPKFRYPGWRTALEMMPRASNTNDNSSVLTTNQRQRKARKPDHVYSTDDLRAWFPDLVKQVEEAAVDELVDAKIEIKKLKEQVVTLKAQLAELRKKRSLVIESDIRYTPRPLAKTIIDHFKPSGSVLEPARGDGSFYDQFPTDCRKEWCEIREVDGRESRNFLGWTESVDWIITNGPWSPQAHSRFQKHSFDVAENVVLLLPGHMGVSTYSRLKHAKEAGHGLKEIVILDWPDGWPQYGFVLTATHWLRGYNGPVTHTDLSQKTRGACQPECLGSDIRNWASALDQPDEAESVSARFGIDQTNAAAELVA